MSPKQGHIRYLDYILDDIKALMSSLSGIPWLLCGLLCEGIGYYSLKCIFDEIEEAWFLR